MRFLMQWIAMVAMVACLTGCAFIEPTTRVGGGLFGWEFVDTKDNDILIKNAEYDPKTQQFKVEEIKVTNKASDVVAANVEQMLAFTEQQRAANEGLIGVVKELANAAVAMTGAKVTTQPTP